MSRRDPWWAICVCLAADCGFGSKVGCEDAMRGGYRGNPSESQMTRSFVRIYALVCGCAKVCDALGGGCGGFFV